jgi:hypothetical protein
MSGYCYCACRDCFEIAIRDDGEINVMCTECTEAGCEPHAETECQGSGAYAAEQDYIETEGEDALSYIERTKR